MYARRVEIESRRKGSVRRSTGGGNGLTGDDNGATGGGNSDTGDGNGGAGDGNGGAGDGNSATGDDNCATGEGNGDAGDEGGCAGQANKYGIQGDVRSGVRPFVGGFFDAKVVGVQLRFEEQEGCEAARSVGNFARFYGGERAFQ